MPILPHYLKIRVVILAAELTGAITSCRGIGQRCSMHTSASGPLSCPFHVKLVINQYLSPSSIVHIVRMKVRLPRCSASLLGEQL